MRDPRLRTEAGYPVRDCFPPTLHRGEEGIRRTLCWLEDPGPGRDCPSGNRPV